MNRFYLKISMICASILLVSACVYEHDNGYDEDVSQKESAVEEVQEGGGNEVLPIGGGAACKAFRACRIGCREANLGPGGELTVGESLTACFSGCGLNPCGLKKGKKIIKI